MRRTVLFVVGTARSGSTILGRSLAARMGYAFIGETKFFPSRLLQESSRWTCSCGRSPQRDCVLWGPVFADLSARLGMDERRELDLASRRSGSRRGPGNRASLDGLLGELESIYERFWEQTNTVLVDTSKDVAIARRLSERGVDVRLLHVARDPRAIDFSRRQRPVKGYVRGSSLQVALNWVKLNRSATALALELPHAHRVRYEDFCLDPAQTMARTADRLQLLRPETGFSGGLVHDFASNPGVRSRERSDGPPEIVYDRQWETELPASARLIVTTVTSPLLRRYGYLVDAR